MDIWITTNEAIDLLGISKQAFHKARLLRKYKCRPVFDTGGIQYQVYLASLPSELQVKYWDKKNDNPEEKHEAVLTDAEIYAAAPEFARKKADKYLALITQSKGLVGNALKAFIADWNRQNPDAKSSYARLLDARRVYQTEGLCGLLGQWGGRAGSSKVPDDLFAFFKSLYLKQGRPSAKSCWKMTYAHAAENGYDIDLTNFPSHMAFVRRLKADVPEQAVFAARNGLAAANKKYGYYIKRNYDDVLVGECWVADHAQVDVAVMYQKNGKTKYAFPWITVWRDLKSGKWLGWDHHIEDPNTDHILMSIQRAATQFGICSEMILDNGKDFRAKTFTGGRRAFKLDVDTTKVRSLTGALGITVHFAWPYNAQSKPIERDFLRNKEWFSKHDSAYRGGNVVEKPEILKKVIKSGNFMSFEEYKKTMDMFIIDVINQAVVSSGHRKGMSPDKMWSDEYQQSIDTKKVKHISSNALMLFCMRTSSDMSISRRGIRDTALGVDYYNSWMEGCKGRRKVYLRRDPQKMQEAWVFDTQTNDFLGKAFINNEVSALANKSDVSRQQLQQQIAIKRSAENMLKNFSNVDYDNISTQQKMHLLSRAEKLLQSESKHLDTDSMTINPVIEATEMDAVIAKQNQFERSGLQDFSILGLHRIKKEEEKKKIFMWPSERDAAMR